KWLHPHPCIYHPNPNAGTCVAGHTQGNIVSRRNSRRSRNDREQRSLQERIDPLRHNAGGCKATPSTRASRSTIWFVFHTPGKLLGNRWERQSRLSEQSPSFSNVADCQRIPA